MKNLPPADPDNEDLITLHWRVLTSDQLWQAAHGPYLCTVVRSLDGDGFYATIVRSGDLFLVVLEDAATLAAAQAWCAERVMRGLTS